MKTVLMIAPVPAMAAATRFRLQQFLPELTRHGVRAEIRSFLSADHMRALYAASSVRDVLKTGLMGLGRRLEDVWDARKVDLVVVQREMAIVGPPLLEWVVGQAMRRPMVFDFDDAIWESYVSPTFGRWLPRLVKMPGKTRHNIAAAMEVIAGNEYLATYARQYNSHVTVIPTVVDTSLYKPAKRTNAVPILGWIGSHSTAPYLRSILPALERVARTHDFVLRVIGAQLEAPKLRCELRPWNLATEIRDFQALDVGLYPITNDKWSLGKSGFKAIQYMACGVPVVASPVGVINQMIQSGQNGLLAATEDEWVVAITSLLDDRAMRGRLAQAGRDTADAQWSLRKYAPVFVDVLQRCMS